MKRPAHVHIGAFKYKIVDLPDGSDEYGECDDAAHELRLARSFASDAQEAETILHEIFHGIWNQGALEDGDKEERIVYVLSIGLAQAMKQNKTLFRAILKALK
jgi:hypothetical protein